MININSFFSNTDNNKISYKNTAQTGAKVGFAASSAYVLSTLLKRPLEQDKFIKNALSDSSKNSIKHINLNSRRIDNAYKNYLKIFEATKNEFRKSAQLTIAACTVLSAVIGLCAAKLIDMHNKN